MVAGNRCAQIHGVRDIRDITHHSLGALPPGWALVTWTGAVKGPTWLTRLLLPQSFSLRLVLLL